MLELELDMAGRELVTNHLYLSLGWCLLEKTIRYPFIFVRNSILLGFA